MSESNQPKTGGLWARLFGVQAEGAQGEEPAPPAQETPAAVPVAEPPPEPSAPVPTSNGVIAVEEPIVVEAEAPAPVESAPPVIEPPAPVPPVVQAPAGPQTC